MPPLAQSIKRIQQSYGEIKPVRIYATSPACHDQQPPLPYNPLLKPSSVQVDDTAWPTLSHSADSAWVGGLCISFVLGTFVGCCNHVNEENDMDKQGPRTIVL